MSIWPRLSNIVVSLALGIAATAYGLRYLANFPSGSEQPGLWDLTIAVVTDPRFMTAIVLTTVLLRTVIRRERVLPEVLRMGTNRRRLLADVVDVNRSMILPVIAILGACFLTAVVAGLPAYTLDASGSANGELISLGISPPVGIGLQIALVGCTLLAIQTLLASLRIVSGSVIPVVAVALVIWAWGGVSVLQLQTVIDRSSGASIAESLQGGAIAALNSGAYLDVLIAIKGSALEFVVIALLVVVAASFAAVWVVDLRIVRSRRASFVTADSNHLTRIAATSHHQSH